jgi:hypothetical protein
LHDVADKVFLGTQTVGSGPGFTTGTSVPVFLTLVCSKYKLLSMFKRLSISLGKLDIIMSLAVLGL